MESEINYAGKRMKLVEVFDEEKQPNWANKAQTMINAERNAGKAACCIHEGNTHGYYEEMEILFKNEEELLSYAKARKAGLSPEEALASNKVKKAVEGKEDN